MERGETWLSVPQDWHAEMGMWTFSAVSSDTSVTTRRLLPAASEGARTRRRHVGHV